MLANVRKLGVNLAIDYNSGFLNSFPRRLISSGQVPHATLDAVFHIQVRVDYPHMVTTIRIVVPAVEGAGERQMVFRQYAPRYS